MALRNYGRIDWGVTRDDRGHRDYFIKFLIEDTEAEVGPRQIANAPGLPIPGQTWGYAGDVDPFAYCTYYFKCTPIDRNERSYFWVVECKFTTRPINSNRGSEAGEADNPLLEPIGVSGSFLKYSREVTSTRDGLILRSSSHEIIRGDNVTFDHTSATVQITIPLPSLPLTTFTGMMNTVNQSPLWGCPPRTIKLGGATWERKYFGTGSIYYVVTYDFEANFDTFDKKVIDQGTKVLREGGNVDDPLDFEQFKDANGENTTVLLNGEGRPLAAGAPPVEAVVDHYEESNFLVLGIPTTL